MRVMDFMIAHDLVLGTLLGRRQPRDRRGGIDHGARAMRTAASRPP